MKKQEQMILNDILISAKKEIQESQSNNYTTTYQSKQSKENSILDSILAKKELRKKTFGFFIPIEYDKKLIKIAKMQNINKSLLLTLILEKVLADFE